MRTDCMMLHIVWFKRDLRTTDHRPLVAAAQRGRVLPLYIVEPDYWAQPDTSGRQWRFTADCLGELRTALAALGQPLVVRTGDVCAVLHSIRAEYGLAGLWSHEETGNAWTYARDLRVAAYCRAHGVPWTELPQHGVVRRLKSRDGWARLWDRFMADPVATPPHLEPLDVAPGGIPDCNDLGLAPDPCPEQQRGGSIAGQETLRSFLETRGQHYQKSMSSPVSGFDACSRISPYLAAGALSMREATQATWARQRALRDVAAPEWRASMRSFAGRLHWHCHFMQKLEDAPRIEHEAMHRAYAPLRQELQDPHKLAAWAHGETGWPFVDACMRALAATGWLNFRMRAMVMAVASYHLWLPWRASGLVLARRFTDYEPGIHWPQVQMQSGTTGINTIRIYNPVKQGYDQDPDGRFVRRWVPELAEVPDAYIHEPWRWPEAARLLDTRYPAPIADHLAAARAARDAIWAARRGPEFRTEAERIQTRHGSRKSGTRPTRPARKAALPLFDDR